MQKKEWKTPTSVEAQDTEAVRKSDNRQHMEKREKKAGCVILHRREDEALN
jgi:hypothetical protein